MALHGVLTRPPRTRCRDRLDSTDAVEISVRIRIKWGLERKEGVEVLMRDASIARVRRVGGTVCQNNLVGLCA